MQIDSVRVSTMNYQRVVILKEKHDDRYLPIWIGPAEADAIAVKLQDVAVPRPLTHDLVTSILTSLGATVKYIVVNDLRNDTFYAKICLDIKGEQPLEIDSRPSDALAIAVRVKSPIFAEEKVLEKAGIVLDKETGKPVFSGEEEQKGLSEEEVKKLSPFREVIDKLNLEDLDKGKA